MKFTIQRTDLRIHCPVHGDGVVVVLKEEDDHGFRKVISACYRCFEAQVEQYEAQRVCVCGKPVAKGDGIEKDGVLEPVCRGCQAARLLGG